MAKRNSLDEAMDGALLRAAGARDKPDRARQAVGSFQAAIVPSGERPDQAAARSPQAVASHLGYTPEQILLWGRFPGTGSHIESSDVLREESAQDEPVGPAVGQVPELDTAPVSAAAASRHATCARRGATPTP